MAYLQVICIVLVVFGHSLYYYPDGEQGKSLLCYRMLYSFRMPVFMFVSGFLMMFTTRLRGNTRRRPTSEFIRSKLTRLLLPFAVLTLVTFVPRAAMSSLADDTIEFSWRMFALSFVDSGHLVIPFFWFLQASFILLCICYMTLTLMERKGVGTGTATLVIMTMLAVIGFLPVDFTDWFALNEVARLGVFFGLGMGYAKWQPTVDKFIKWTSPLTAITAATCWAVLYFATENSLLSPLCSLAGIAMCVSIARVLEQRHTTWLDRLVGANYMIFLLSWYCNVLSQQVLGHFVQLPWWIHSALSLVSGIYIPWLGYRYLQRHPGSRWVRITAYLLGQRLHPGYKK